MHNQINIMLMIILMAKRNLFAKDRGAPPCTSPAASLLICLTLAMVEVALLIIFVFIIISTM